VPNHLKSVFEIKVEKSMNKKYVAIATILIFLVIIGLMIMRGRKDRYEGDEASELLTEIKDQLQSIGTLWAKIKANLEDMEILSVENEIPELRNQIDNTKTAREDIKEMKSNLESIKNQHDKAKKTLDEIKKLELPEWTYDYIELQNERTEKDEERVDKTNNILTNLDLYYAYSEEFYEGKIAELNMEKNLEEGINNFLEENIDSAREKFEEAMDNNSKVEKHIKTASERISFNYLEKASSNREDTEEIIRKLQEVCDLVEKGSYSEANDLFLEADKEYEELKRLYPSDLMPEHREWWSKNVDSPVSELRDLSRAIEDIESQAKSLIKKNTE
jgi:hypothetical protein